MLRWRLIVGLSATLLILLLVGTYGLYLFSALGKSVDSVLKDNYDSIKVCHFLRVTTARVNIFYTRGDRPNPPYDQPEMLDRSERDVKEKLPILLRNARDEASAGLVRQLEATVAEYFGSYRRVFAEYAAQDSAYHQTRGTIGELTLRITNLAETILQQNEHQMLLANQRVDKQARDSIKLLVIAMSSAVIVFIFTYVRMGQSLITPVRKLTHSIRELRTRHFDQSLAVTSSDELGELTKEFNGMALELRSFYRETDRKFIELNQVIRAMMTTLPYPLFILDAQDALQRINPAAERFLADLQCQESLPAVLQKHLAETPVTGPEYTLHDLKQTLLFRLREEEHYFLPRVFPIVLEDGSLFGRALMLIDVSRFRWLDDLRADMLATLSHEIRTPLTNIRLVLHLLLDKSTGPLLPAQDDLVTSAYEDCERLLRTLNTLLDLARMESGQVQLELHATTPETLLQDAELAYGDSVHATGRRLSLDSEPGLPLVQVDRDRIALVFSNLLSNAVKYGNPRSLITVKARSLDAGHVRFTVQNEGPGLSESEQGRIFDKFYRIPKTPGEGVGLGLSIARQIISAHEGRIGVASEAGRLTEFYFDLPVT